jgi:putative transcriptional regulator
MKKVQIFDDLMEGFEEAINYRRGKKANVRVSQFMMAADPLRPREIRRIRHRLGFSQSLFARYLGTRVGTVRSWEQGVRRPNSTALRLLTIARDSPAVLLKRAAYRR